MRLIRFKTGTEEKNGVVVNGGLVEIPHSLLEASQAPFDDLERKDFYSLDDVNILPPVQPSKVVCVGLNYRDHAQELNMDLPEEPILFIKPPTTVIGPDNPIIYPPQCHQLDYEAELAVVIGRETRFTSKNDARDHIAGYTILNKSFDTFCPLGPWLVTKDEIPDPGNLRIRALLNGVVMQDATTAAMIFDVPAIVSNLSRSMTLYPGTVILTGTPEGVGYTRKPPVFLKDGDAVVVSVEKIGDLVNPVVREV